MRKRIAAAALAATLAAVQVGAQDDPEPPVLHPFGGGFDCSITQTLAGDVVELSCIAVDSPLANGFDYELINVTRYETFTGNHWLKFTLRANQEIRQVLLEYTFYEPGDIYGASKTSGYDSNLQDLRVGSRAEVTVLPDIDTWDHVSITSLDGFVCKGCGAYAADNLPASTTLDMGSFAPEDAAAVFNEISNRVNPRWR